MPEEEPLGLKRGEAVVVPYDPRWAELFAEARSELVSTLGTSILGVHHVGSTSVSGLCAKPILDLLVLVPNFDEAVRLAPELAAIGYEFRPEEFVPDRHFFRRPHGGDIRTHHLSMSEPGSDNERMMIAFRDALYDNPGLTEAYGNLKRDLARRFPKDRPRYIEEKSVFIGQLLAHRGFT
jgi:GrpB-like predicted nucleotidyltransferase (UPF0157 family)